MIKAHRKPSSLPSLASIMTYRKRRNVDEESTNKVLADEREVDEHTEKLMRKLNFAQMVVTYAANI
jgi:hypothetical protein